jgi:hypothetical protein
MSINGVDVTKQFSTICGTTWLITYIILVLFIFTRKPRNKSQRRWKAKFLVGGLPVLGIPFLFGIFSIILLLQNGTAKAMTPAELFMESYTSIMATVTCTLPIVAVMSIFAILGTHSRMKFSDYWLNKIVPPSKNDLSLEMVT